MSKTKELCIGMFVTNKDKDLPIKGKIKTFTLDGKAIVQNYLDNEEYTVGAQTLQEINCMYSARVFTIGNGEKEFGEYPTLAQLWEDINEANSLSQEDPMDAIVSIIVYTRQEYLPAVINAEYIIDNDVQYAWEEYEHANHLIGVDETELEVLEDRLNEIYVDWLREYNYMPNCGDLLETKVYHVRNNLFTYSHTINNIKNTQETT